jgi:AraC family transcriptional regulator
VHFYVPNNALHPIADEANATRVDGLRYKPAVSHADAFLQNIASALLPLFRFSEDANQILIDHLMLAVGHHVAVAYCGTRLVTMPFAGGLRPLQERRAKEHLEASSLCNLRLVDLARGCGLSASHFTKFFRQSVGMPAGHWLLQKRLERAKRPLRDRGSHLLKSL